MNLKTLLDDFVWNGRRLERHRSDVVMASVRLLDPSGERFRFIASSGWNSEEPADIAHLEDSLAFATKDLRPLSIDAIFARPGDVPPAHSLIVVPLLVQGTVRGVLRVSVEHETRATDKSYALVLGALAAYNLWPPKIANPISTNVGMAMSGIRRVIGMSQDTLASRIPVGRIALSRWESGAQPPSWNQVVKWCNALGVLAPRTRPVVRIVENITPELLRFLKEEPSRLRQLTPERFEQFAAERLDRMGYNVSLAGPTMRKDGGVDIIAVPKNASVGTFLLAGQVKHHSGDQRTGREAVDRLVSLKNSVFRLGLLVTNTEFTADAKWAAAKDDARFFARLRDIEDIKRWLEEDFQSEAEFRELPDEIELAPGVRIKVPRPELSEEDTKRMWPMAQEKLDPTKLF